MSIILHNQILKIKIDRELDDEEAAVIINHLKHEIKVSMSYFQSRVEGIDASLEVTLED